MTHLSDTARQTLPAPCPRQRAVTRRRYGGPEVVGLETLERPEPAAERAVAAGPRGRAGPGDAAPARGQALSRAVGLPGSAGPDGRSSAAGGRRGGRRRRGRQWVCRGDRVFGTADGSFAEHAVAKGLQVAATPDTVRDVDAATLGVSGTTARWMRSTTSEVAAGRRSSSSGVRCGRHPVVQLAVHRGAEVTAVCSAAKLDLVRGLGAVRGRLPEHADHRPGWSPSTPSSISPATARCPS